MIALIQRVRQASVVVNGEKIADIQQGLLVLLAVEKEDNFALADKLLQKIVKYRMFSDDDEKMNLSLKDIAGQLLVVSQFTLAADTNKGLRPSFSSAAPPVLAERLYEYFLKSAKELDIDVQSGQFGADMQVSLVNDGPVTFSLKV
ncbi:MAG: D-tyrosyl-tRNA(Tyr) deacylase [Psychrobium sp.]|nr:D-tyrosyl-tRNA(Tyr) deacylase [Psychrobium sp.]